MSIMYFYPPDPAGFPPWSILARILPGWMICLAASLSAALAPGGAFAQSPVYTGSPRLEARVQEELLPPVEERLPKQPAIAKIGANGGRLGRHGGTWRMLIYRPKDVRMMKVYGYARLMGYNREYKLEPDILRAFKVKEGRIFTFTLREGHKWSDGHPFTPGDFRYFWEDVAQNKELYPGGIPRNLLVNGEPPKFEVLGKSTVRYSWRAPNPYFLNALAKPLPLGIYLPAHYLKRFHARYADPEKLAERVRRSKKPNWAALHHAKDDFRNPLLPSLQPWVNTTPVPAKRFVGVRNPYYHRVDRTGKQLPYIDSFHITLSNHKLIPAQAGSGVVDLQARGLTFNDFTFLKAGEYRHGYAVRLWRRARGAQLALYPNLTVSDPVWRKLFQDVRFRRALSISIDRHEINQVLFYGLSSVGNNSVIEGSSLYRPEYRKAWSQFDLDQANRLLDDMGLDKRNDEDIRLLPDGRLLEIVVETAGESNIQSDVLELIRDNWEKAGIRLFSKHSQREVFRRRVFSGETQMSVWAGIENGIATADSDPWELAPVARISLQWAKWGQYYETKGRVGEPVDLPAAQELLREYGRWRTAATRGQRKQAWRNLLRIYSEQVFSIGLIAGVLQPVVVQGDLMNVPVEGVYNWDPGAYFGIYRPDTFWFRESASPASAANSSR